MRKIKKLFLTIGLLVIIAIICLVAYSFSETPIPTPSLTDDGNNIMNEEKLVRGLVLENKLGCRVNARCYLRLLSNNQEILNQEILIIYHYGEWPPCINEKAVHQGEQLKEGDEVEVFGQYEEIDNKPTISTCDSKAYYIRKIQ